MKQAMEGLFARPSPPAASPNLTGTPFPAPFSYPPHPLPSPPFALALLSPQPHLLRLPRLLLPAIPIKHKSKSASRLLETIGLTVLRRPALPISPPPGHAAPKPIAAPRDCTRDPVPAQTSANGSANKDAPAHASEDELSPASPRALRKSTLTAARRLRSNPHPHPPNTPSSYPSDSNSDPTQPPSPHTHLSAKGKDANLPLPLRATDLFTDAEILSEHASPSLAVLREAAALT